MQNKTLNELFELQEEYQKKLGYDVEDMSHDEKRQYRQDCMLALYQEVAELVDSTPWKPWRSEEDQTLDIPNAEREIIDCLFFLFNIARTLGISGRDLEDRFHKVLSNNLARIESGYNN
jgi:NTP pyrophosphatase (non-canonical NTP hydrolase)